MQITFERGDPQRPKGHALLYFQSWTDQSAVFATYLIVPPIAVEITKYIPPMFAGQFQQMGLGAGGISVFPYPPIPERVESHALLQRLAKAREDDLITGGAVDASSPERLLQAASEAAAQYFQQFSTHMESIPSEAAPEALLEEETGSVEVNEILYGLMGDRDRLAELAKLSGQLRYAISGNDPNLLKETVAEARRLAKFLPEKYRVDQVIQAAQHPGTKGDRLTQLYLDRAYKLADEDYQAVKQIEDEIHKEEVA